MYVVEKQPSRRITGTRVHRRPSWAIREMAQWKKHSKYKAEGSPRTSRAICSRADTRPALPVDWIRPNLRWQLATQPTREASPTVISRADRVRASCWSPVHRLKSPSFSTIVKIVRFSKTSISVPKIQTCFSTVSKFTQPERAGDRGESPGLEPSRNHYRTNDLSAVPRGLQPLENDGAT